MAEIKSRKPADRPAREPMARGNRPDRGGDRVEEIPEGLSGLNIAIPGAGSDAPAATQPAKPPAQPKPAKGGWWWGTGRRKRAVARVRLKPASGGKAGITISVTGNKTKTVEQYFPEERDRLDAAAPLRVTNTLERFEVHARLDGGGLMGQAQALRMGLSRALRDYDPAFEAALRDNGFLTRDSREVERKKYGQAGARRRFQFSKR